MHKRGIYETTYGNAAYVSGPKAKKAWDLDMAKWIPISEVTEKWIRKVEPEDTVRGVGEPRGEW